MAIVGADPAELVGSGEGGGMVAVAAPPAAEVLGRSPMRPTALSAT
jgi:hypothetical protein